MATRPMKNSSSAFCKTTTAGPAASARELLDNWSEARQKFVKVFPNEYKRALSERKERQLLAATETTRAQVATKLAAVAAS